MVSSFVLGVRRTRDVLPALAAEAPGFARTLRSAAAKTHEGVRNVCKAVANVGKQTDLSVGASSFPQHNPPLRGLTRSTWVKISKNRARDRAQHDTGLHADKCGSFLARTHARVCEQAWRQMQMHGGNYLMIK